jgi:hypothetical protein
MRPARAIAESVNERLGLQFAVVFSRQAGKDETLAQLIAWLLTRYQIAGGTIVVAAPTRTLQANITYHPRSGCRSIEAVGADGGEGTGS